MYRLKDFDKSSKNMHIMLKAISIMIYIIIIPIIIFNITLVVKSCLNPNETPTFFGIKSFVIVSKSMEPTIMTGDAIFVKQISEDDVKVGDIISFKDGDSVNTHRIIEIVENNGVKRYKTKGDNNKREDRNLVKYSQIEGKYEFRIKGFGKFIEILKNKITLVILLIILVLVSTMQVRLSKKKLERKEKRYKYNLEHRKKVL